MVKNGQKFHVEKIGKNEFGLRFKNEIEEEIKLAILRSSST